jgi:hypothetical protein
MTTSEATTAGIGTQRPSRIMLRTAAIEGKADVGWLLSDGGSLPHDGSEDWAASLVWLGNAVAKLPPDFPGGE